MALTAHEIALLSQDELKQADIEYFRGKYGLRFVRALRAVEERRVAEYHFKPSGSNAWIIRGLRREYFVIPEVYCSCRSFYQSVVIARKVDACYHLLAQRIAEIRSSYETVESTDADRRRLFVQWRRTD
jgi:predicted nucleic acid-binding Zn finger protein